VGWGVRVHVCGGQEEEQFQDAELAGVGIKARYEIVKLVKPCGFIFVGFSDYSEVYQSRTLVCYLRRTLYDTTPTSLGGHVRAHAVLHKFFFRLLGDADGSTDRLLVGVDALVWRVRLFVTDLLLQLFNLLFKSAKLTGSAAGRHARTHTHTHTHTLSLSLSLSLSHTHTHTHTH
jgi:hypothetical protein